MMARASAIDPCRGLVGQEHDAGLGAELDHVPRAVVFLVAPRALVLLDDVLLVLVDREASGNAGLLVRTHLQPVEIERRRLLDGQRRRPAQLLEILAPALIDGGRVGIRSRREVDLGPRDVQKTQGIARGELTRFFGVDDVVGNGGNRRRIRGHRPQCPEGVTGEPSEYLKAVELSAVSYRAGQKDFLTADV